MGFPLAVNPSVRSPGLALSVNLLASSSSPGTAALRGCIMGSKTASGTITADTQVVQGLAGPDDVSTYCGIGSPAHLASKALFAEYGLAQVDLVAPAEAAGVAATQTLVFDSTTPVTVAQTVTWFIAGRAVQIVWLPGVSGIAAATLMVAAVNALTGDLPVSARTAAARARRSRSPSS
jgi:phage tail sheath gpL-like